MSDIFISYSRYDSDKVNELVALLEQEGYSIWIDRDGIESGDDFKRVILKSIKESKVILFFSSEHSNSSDWTAKEIGVAVKYKKHIIPIKLDNSNYNEAVEFDLINLDYVDYSRALNRLAMRERLFKALRNKLDKGNRINEQLEIQRKTEAEKIIKVKDIFPKNENCPEGAINGIFSVSSTKKVYFSKGNLQYQASTKIWRFAERQYDIIGEDNKYTSFNYSGWIDLFGWGTGNDPTNCKEWNYDYKYFADWAINLISNGGNKVDLWHTLSSDEWKFVLKTRKTLSGIRYVKANVCGVNGVILIPDGWKSGDYCFNQTNDFESDFKNNLIDALQWLLLEQKGIVFLPAAGYRSGSSVLNERWYGNYWSASSGNDDYASYLCFNSSNLSPSSVNNRFDGRSVRPVCSAE